MENSWQVKCGSSSTPYMAPSSSLEPRDQMNTGYHSYPHVGSDLRSTVLGRMDDPVFSNSLNFSIHRPGCADLGNSFLALLSGPPSLLQCDFQELSYPKASGSCGKLPSNGTSVTANAFGSDIPLISSGLLSENLSNQNVRNGADFCPVVSSRAVLSSNCSGNSVLHDLQGSDLAKAVISHIVPGSEKVKGPYLSGGWHGTSPVNTGKLNSMNVQSSQKMPLEANSSITKQSSTFMSGCPRVFCLDTTGYLLLSNTGLLGIVCLCHCFHMSVSKFCEHSGLCDVNPGDVVHMDSGETIAQWRKLYFQKFRIRVPEDQSEWDWPEGLSVTAGFVKSRVTNPNLCKSSDLSHRVGSSGGLVRSRQPLDQVHFPKNPHTDQKSLIDALQNEKQRNFQDVDNFLLKSSVGTSWRNLHAAVDNQMMECPMSRCSTMQKFVGTGVDNGCQSISAYIDGIMKNGNPSTSYSTLQNVKDLSKDSDVSKTKNAKDSVIVGRDAASSNIELRLGQPYQPSRTSGNSILPVIGAQLFDKLGNPPKSCFPWQMIHNANYREEDYRQYHQCVADPFNSSIERESSRLNLGNHAFGISHAIDAARLENFKCNAAKSSVVSPLMDFNNPADSVHSKAKVNMVNGSEHMMHKALHCSSHAAECDPFTACWNGGNCLERQLNISELDSVRLTDKGKGVGCVAHTSYVAMDTGFGNHKQVPNSVLGGSSESAVNDKSRHLHQLSSVPSDASDARNLFSHVEKDPCLRSSGQGDHVPRSNLPLQGVSMGFPLVTSTSTPDNTRPLLKQEGTSVSPYLLDENLRLLALRQIMELSKQQHALSSIINQERGKYRSSSNVQHAIVDPSTSQEQRHGPDFTSKQDVSEATMNLLRSAPTFRGSDDIKKVPSVTGLYDCCNISTSTPGNPFHPEGISLPSELSDGPIQNEQPSLRFGRSDNNVSRPSEHEICCQRVPYTYYQGKCSCEARTNYLGRNVNPKVGSSPNAFKEQMGTGSGEASTILTSRFTKDPFLLMDTSIALDQSGKLNGKLNKNIVCHASQWRDVPTKVKGVCDATVVARLANVFERREHDGCQLGDASAKYFNGAMQITDSLKDQENSNVSSGCSAPAVTQASIEVNNIDFSTVDAGDTGDVSNHIVDEGSGIDICWSPDDALGSERSAEFLGSSCNIKLRKEGSSHIVNNQSRSLLDELKLIDSLTWKKSRHQIHTGLAIRGKSNTSQQTESGLKMGKRKKEMKLKMLSTPFLSAGPSLLPYENPKCVATAELSTCSSKDGQGTCHTSGACLIQPRSKSRLSSAKTSSRKRGAREDDYQTELNYDTDFGKSPEVSGRKKLRRDFASDAFRQCQIQEPTHEEAEKTEKYNSVGSIRTSSSPQVNVCCWKARPVVCGKYGEISCGKDVSKPAKIVPLSRILKTASRCSLPKSCKPRLTSMRELRKKNSTLIDLSCAKLTGLNNEEDNGSHNVAVCDRTNCDSSMEETYKAWCSNKQFAKKLSILEKERDDKSEKDRQLKDHSILDSNIPAQLKLKCKEIRKRSIYELTIKGKKSSSDSVPLPKIPDCIPEMKVRQILKNAEDSNHDLNRVCSNKSIHEHRCLSISNSDAFCCVCGSSSQDDINCLLECGRCLIRVHQACYGVSKVPKGRWYCRPCRTSSKDIVCVLCGYGGGAMTRALRSRTVVKGILKAWNVETDCRHKKMISSAESVQKELSVLHSSGSVLEGNSFHLVQPVNIKSSTIAVREMDVEKQLDVQNDSLCCISNLKAHNSITAGVLDSTVKQWVHMVCGLWTPRTRCPNVDTMTAFDVSGASHPRANVVCSMCNRPGGSCIECRVVGCHIQFHPWCAHQKGLLQSEIEGVANENVGFYGRCVLHATYATSESDCDPINSEIGCQGEKELTCARTEGYKGRKQDDHQCDLYGKSKGKGGCLVPQEQLNAWIHINGQKPCTPGLPKLAISDIEYDCRKEYARYKQAKGWKHLVVYKSGIHALGLYTSRFISRGEMVVEYVGEIVGLRVADKRENEYQSGRKLQYKSACYFFRIDKEHIIDATRKGGIARFVNHSCLPNCVAKVISVRTEKKVVFFAERDIFPGEEITYDYHFNHEDEGKKIPCFCNSKNCRRYLN